MAEEPLAPAWNDVITVSDPTRGTRYNLQIAALWTPVHSIVRGEEEEEEGSGTVLEFAPYQIPEMRPSMGDDDFQMQAKALVHISKPPGGGEGDGQGMQVDGFFLLLFEVCEPPPSRPTRPSTNTTHQHNTSLPFSLPPPWKDPNPIRQLGPSAFQTFPSHHFFARNYRPQAASPPPPQCPRPILTSWVPDLHRPPNPQTHLSLRAPLVRTASQVSTLPLGAPATSKTK